MRLHWRSLVVALWLALWLPAAGARPSPAPWPEAPFSHYAENTPLDKVLGDFAAGFSLRLELGDEVSGTGQRPLQREVAQRVHRPPRRCLRLRLVRAPGHAARGAQQPGGEPRTGGAAGGP
jgi:hypothetical protein